MRTRALSLLFLVVMLASLSLGGCALRKRTAEPEAPRPPPMTPAALPPAPAPARPAVPNLIGRSDQEVKTILGEPRLVRREGSGLLWQYAAETCVLNVFLYPPIGKPRDTDRVTHLDARDRAANPVTPEFCLAQLLR